jgi:hypothetical protein
MMRKLRALGFLVALMAAPAGAIVAAGASGGAAAAGTAASQKPLRFEAHDLFIETNATDRDAGLQMNLDGEDWKRFKLVDPHGKVLVDLRAKGRLRGLGLTELFFEASEPAFSEVPFSRFKKRFPEGRYRFRGLTVDGHRLVGSDRLSHLIPAGPRVTFPTRGARVDPSGLKVTWEPVTSPAGVEIVSYQVIVSQGKRELSMYLPPSATSASIPAEFLRPGTATGGEVLAREKSGNQTITQIPPFRTS